MTVVGRELETAAMERMLDRLHEGHGGGLISHANSVLSASC